MVTLHDRLKDIAWSQVWFEYSLYTAIRREGQKTRKELRRIKRDGRTLKDDLRFGHYLTAMARDDIREEGLRTRQDIQQVEKRLAGDERDDQRRKRQARQKGGK